VSVNANTATAKDFERAAQYHANSFWVWGGVTGIVFYFGGKFGFIPAVVVLYSVIQSVGATMAAMALRKGTYRIPNPNNGAPDGDGFYGES
jgi:hypothetical protein